MSKKVRRIVGRVAPIVAPLIPGVGTLGAIAIGAAGGAASGGGLKGALLGGATAGLGAGGGSYLAGKAGLSGVAKQAASRAITGAAGSAFNGGDAGDIALGAALGGVSGAVSGGLNIPGLGSTAGASLDQVTGIEGLQGPTQGSGTLGSLTQGSKGAAGMNLSSLLRPAGTALSAYNQTQTADEIEEMLLRQQQQNRALFAPYQEAGRQGADNLANFDQETLVNDPGYQFRLKEGEKALTRAQSARGGLYSGAALKEAQQFGQGLADQTYNDAFNRNLSLSNQGIDVARALSGVNNNVGNIQAGAETMRSNALNQMISRLLRGENDDSFFI